MKLCSSQGSFMAKILKADTLPSLNLPDPSSRPPITVIPADMTSQREVRTVVALNKATGSKGLIKLVRSVASSQQQQRPQKRTEKRLNVRLAASRARRQYGLLPQGARLEVKSSGEGGCQPVQSMVMAKESSFCPICLGK